MLEKFIIIFAFVFSIHNTCIVNIAFAVNTPRQQYGLCKTPRSLGLSLHSNGIMRVDKSYPMYYFRKPPGLLALPKGSDDFWYDTRISGPCEREQFEDWCEPIVYAI